MDLCYKWDPEIVVIILTASLEEICQGFSIVS